MCQFTIPFTSPAEALIRKAQRAITSAGGSFEGDTSAGKISVKTMVGNIEGSYQVAGSEIAITITDKPFLVSCARIEKELKGVMV